MLILCLVPNSLNSSSTTTLLNSITGKRITVHAIKVHNSIIIDVLITLNIYLDHSEKLETHHISIKDHKYAQQFVGLFCWVGLLLPQINPLSIIFWMFYWLSQHLYLPVYNSKQNMFFYVSKQFCVSIQFTKIKEE